MRRQWMLFLCAVQFLTRIPIPALNGFQPDWITRSARYYSLVGQLVGVVSALVLLGASQVWGAGIAAVLALGAGILLTGAFHEDGLADTADGLGGGRTPDRRLEIMKDSGIGTYGVVALLLALGLKGAALAELEPARAALALIAAHGLARAAAVVVMRFTPYAPAGAAAKWSPTTGGVTTREMLVALALTAWPLLILPPMTVGLGLLIGGLGVAAVALMARRLVGGHTGDILGAAEQVFEVGFLLGAAALLV